MKPREHVLKLLEASATVIVSDVGFPVSVETFSYEVENAVFRLRSFVWAEDETLRKYTFRAPSSWWQGLRAAVLDNRGRIDRWILKRWPLRYRVSRVEVEQLYPELARSIPADRHRPERYVRAIWDQRESSEIFSEQPMTQEIEDRNCPACGKPWKIHEQMELDRLHRSGL